MTDVRVTSQDRIDVTREGSALIFVDGVRGVGRVSLDRNLSAAASAAEAWFRGVGDRWLAASGHALLRR